MSWLNFFGKTEVTNPDTDRMLSSLREKFLNFNQLISLNRQLLRVISDLEEKSHGEYLFDINYVHQTVDEIVTGVGSLIDEMVAIGGDSYKPLHDRFKAINRDLDWILEGHREIEKSDYTIRYRKLNSQYINVTGSKNAQLGELANKLRLPVPHGFAITAWAYKRFMDAGNLQTRISKRISSINIRRYDDLVRFSAEIQRMIVTNPVPDDLSADIEQCLKMLLEQNYYKSFAVRSSAIGEDSHHSFAGQYATYLNVHTDDIINKYREVLASKFGPKAIYYYLSHDLSESDMAMCVGCVGMIDAAVSGVIYTRNPVDRSHNSLLISAIYGLGTYLVEGTITPDNFLLDRSSLDIISESLARKEVKLVMNPDGGTMEIPIPKAEQNVSVLSPDQLRQLAEMALKIESHYSFPQDIEWVIDKQGEPFIVQTRPLHLMEIVSTESEPDTTEFEVIASGGNTVCPGAGIGKLFHLNSAEELPNVPDGAVLLVRHPFLRLITAMDKISALVTEIGSIASHISTIAREYRIPTIMGLHESERLTDGLEVTVDATQATIYGGAHHELVKARRPKADLFDDINLLELLDRILVKITPLNLLRTTDDNFNIDSCDTFHDIIRYCHQQSIHELFSFSNETAHKGSVGSWLDSGLPIPMKVISLNERSHHLSGRKRIKVDQINSAPMKRFWGGIMKEGWPQHMPADSRSNGYKLKTARISKKDERNFEDISFAVLDEEYMIVSLRMGYHFTTFEAKLTDNAEDNYVRMQFKGGGAANDRRLRRIKLIADILAVAGFTNTISGDFLDTILSGLEPDVIGDKLYMLGRLTMMSKQLDMALNNDAIAQWYRDTFQKKLGLEQ